MRDIELTDRTHKALLDYLMGNKFPEGKDWEYLYSAPQNPRTIDDTIRHLLFVAYDNSQ